MPPILLPAIHPVVSLITTDKHKSLMHAGVKTTLSELKERFWIIKGRQMMSQMMPDLSTHSSLLVFSFLRFATRVSVIYSENTFRYVDCHLTLVQSDHVSMF